MPSEKVRQERKGEDKRRKQLRDQMLKVDEQEKEGECEREREREKDEGEEEEKEKEALGVMYLAVRACDK